MTVKDGSKFKGIFHGASTEGDLGIALKLAQKVHDPSTPVKNTLLIFSKDLVEINAAQVDFSSTESTTHDRNSKFCLYSLILVLISISLQDGYRY